MRVTHRNNITEIPAAACGFCGGWTNFGGMGHHAKTTTPVLGRTGCTGPHCFVNDEAREIARTTVTNHPTN